MTSYLMMKALKVPLTDILICAIGSLSNAKCDCLKFFVQSNNESTKNANLISKEPNQAILEDQGFQVLQDLLGRPSCQRSKRVEATTRAAKLKVKMKYLDQETNLRRIQLEREITLADAEEEPIKLVMDEEVKNGIVRRYKI